MRRNSQPTTGARYFSAARQAARWCFGACLALTLVLACSFAPTRTVTREDSFEVGTASQLKVASENGGVSVRGSADSTSIQVTATIKNPDQVSYQTRQEGNIVTIEAESEGGFNLFRGNGSTSLEVIVPLQTDLDLKTSNGRLSVAEIHGAVTAITSNGSINMAEVEGNVSTRTSNGSIEIGPVSGQVQAESSNGSLRLAAALPSRSQNRLQTSNGSVTVTLLQPTGVNLLAATSNGSVSSDLPITTTGLQERNRVQGTIGDGQADLQIKTSNGNIRIQ